jgi:hypothetical protein
MQEGRVSAKSSMTALSIGGPLPAAPALGLLAILLLIGP